MLLLISANSKKENYAEVTEFSAIQPNLYMAMLESYFKSIRVDCVSINCESENISEQELAKTTLLLDPDLIIIVCSGANPSASTMVLPAAKRITRLLKDSGVKCKIALWGGHPTVEPGIVEYTGSDFSLVGQVFNGLPKIDWKKINPSLYKAHNWHCFGQLDKRTPYGVIYTSLGCPYSCEFCCINNLFMKRAYQMRDMNDVVSEIDDLVKLGVKNIKIMDELFITKHPRIDQFCDLLEKRNYDLNMWCFARVDTVDERILSRLKKVGVNWVAYGFESVNQDSLNGISKGNKSSNYDKVVEITYNAGLNIIADVIVGFENDTIDSLLNTYKFLVKHNFEFINIYPLFAFVGTPLFDRVGIKRTPEEYSLFGSTCNPLPTKTMTSAEVLKFRDEAFSNYITRNDYLQKLETKFGKETVEHVKRMASKKIKRNIYGN